MVLAAALALAIQTLDAEPGAAPASDRLRAAASTAASLPHVTLNGYLVQGRNARAIRSDMNNKRPTVSGSRHDAATSWRLGFRVAAQEGGCDPSRAEIRQEIRIVLPDLEDRARLSAREGRAWDRYFQALEGHEVNHARIALIGLERYTQAVRSAPDCPSARQAAAAVLDEISEASVAYDRATEHGRKEGAVFP